MKNRIDMRYRSCIKKLIFLNDKYDQIDSQQVEHHSPLTLTMSAIQYIHSASKNMTSDEIVSVLYQFFEMDKEIHLGLLDTLLSDIKNGDIADPCLDTMRFVMHSVIETECNLSDGIGSQSYHACAAFAHKLQHEKYAFLCLKSEKKEYLKSVRPEEYWYGAVAAMYYTQDGSLLMSLLGDRLDEYNRIGDVNDALYSHLQLLQDEVDLYVPTYGQIAKQIITQYYIGEMTYDDAYNDISIILETYVL